MSIAYRLGRLARWFVSTGSGRLTLLLITVLIIAQAIWPHGSVTPRDQHAAGSEVPADTPPPSPGPRRLLEAAQSALAAGHHEQARSYALTCMSQYPDSPQVIEAQSIRDRAAAELQSIQAGRRRAHASALAGMAKKHDDMRDLTIWRDPRAPVYVNSRSWVGSYVVQPANGSPYLRFVIYYTADDWLFIERYLLKIDGVRFELQPDSYGDNSVNRDNGDGGIWEWWDVPAEGTCLHVLRSLANAKTATIRCEGTHYYKDRDISGDELRAAKHVLAAYDALREVL